MLVGRGATVFLDEKEVVGDNSPQGMGRVREAHAQLEAGHDYKLRVEYRQTSLGAYDQSMYYTDLGAGATYQSTFLDVEAWKDSP